MQIGELLEDVIVDEIVFLRVPLRLDSRFMRGSHHNNGDLAGKHRAIVVSPARSIFTSPSGETDARPASFESNFVSQVTSFFCPSLYWALSCNEGLTGSCPFAAETISKRRTLGSFL